jgi:hypothetical protein
MIASDLASFLEEGIGIHLASRTAALEPNGVRALAVKVEEAGAVLAVYVTTVAAESVLADYRANGQVAVLFGRPVDERSVQVKGIFLDVRDRREDERAMVSGQWEGYRANLGLIGIPRAVYDRGPRWPVRVVRLRVNAIFDQTPGPSAGETLR